MSLSKKILRIVYFIFMAILISVGVALTGVGPILPRNRESIVAKTKTEQVDSPRENPKDNQTELFS